MFTYVEVEPSENCPMSVSMVYKNLSEPFRVAVVKLYEGEPGGRLYAVTGWSSVAGGSPAEAYAVEVEDSSAGRAFVLYGGDWGIRLRPAESNASWSLSDADQWGETHLVLADAEDLTPVDTGQ